MPRTETDLADHGSAADAKVVLDVRDLVKHYPVRKGPTRRGGSIKALDGVSFQLHQGEALGIVGESGCGKSTLARTLMLLERPTSGSASFDGQDMFALHGREQRRLRRRIQLIMQDPYSSLNPRMTVAQIVGEPFEIHREVAPRGSRRQRVQEMLELVGLNPEHYDRYPHQFSGGQRQRIGIARALALRPEVVICDEPVSALDVSIQAQVLNLLASLQQDLGLAYVFIAHDLSVVRHLADRVAVMYLGRIAELGTGSDVYDQPRHPYTQALLSAVPEPTPRNRGTRQPIALTGDVPSPLNPPSGCHFRTRCWLRTQLADRDGEDAVSVCTEKSPALADDGTGHVTACHFVRT